MKPFNIDLVNAIERLKNNNNDFETFTGWIEQSYQEGVTAVIEVSQDILPVHQGYLRALRDMKHVIDNSRAILDRAHKRG